MRWESQNSVEEGREGGELLAGVSFWIVLSKEKGIAVSRARKLRCGSNARRPSVVKVNRKAKMLKRRTLKLSCVSYAIGKEWLRE